MNTNWTTWGRRLLTGIMLVGSFNASASTLALENCHLKGIKQQMLCGTLMVAENPKLPQGKQIPINVAVLPSFSSATKNTPLLMLAGGPGQAATELAAGVNAMFKRVRQTRDIVLIDQRGTGKSNGLKCVDLEKKGLGLDLDLSKEDMKAQSRECLVLLKGSDLTQYTTDRAIDDFEAVRKALGYQQFHLYGGSYGTRSGLVYIRNYPGSIASAVLDSVAPTQLAMGTFGKNAEQSFDLLLQDCNENPQCKAAYPNLKADFVELMAKLSRGDLLSTVDDPVISTQTELRFERERFLTTLHSALYSPTLRKLLPLVIHQAGKGNYKPFVGLYAPMNSTSAPSIYMGMHMSVICSEDWPWVTDKGLKADNDNYVVGNLFAKHFGDACSVWPKAKIDDSFKLPVTSAVPTLLLSGRLDPVTPPEWAEMAAKTLSNSRHLVAVNGAHGVAGHTCAPKLIAQFLIEGDLSKLDDSCLNQKRTMNFMINANATSL
jgi:pimeloyl-ACP methyl ester carboxylesterase